jgi:hypothetical protein
MFFYGPAHGTIRILRHKKYHAIFTTGEGGFGTLCKESIGQGTFFDNLLLIALQLTH